MKGRVPRQSAPTKNFQVFAWYCDGIMVQMRRWLSSRMTGASLILRFWPCVVSIRRTVVMRPADCVAGFAFVPRPCGKFHLERREAARKSARTPGTRAACCHARTRAALRWHSCGTWLRPALWERGQGGLVALCRGLHGIRDFGALLVVRARLSFQR